MIIEYIDGIELCDMPDIDDALKIKFSNQLMPYINMAWFLATPIVVTSL